MFEQLYNTPRITRSRIAGSRQTGKGSMGLLLLACVHATASAVVAQEPAPPAAETLPTVTKVEPFEALRGAQVCIFGTNFPAATGDFKITVGDSAAFAPTAVAGDHSYIMFSLPKDAPLGRQTVRVCITVDNTKTGLLPVPVPGHNYDFTVLREPSDPLTLTGVKPAVFYPGDTTVVLRLFGTGFSKQVADNILVLDDVGELHLADDAPTQPSDGRLRAEAISSRELIVRDVPLDNKGNTKIAVRVGDETSEEQPIIFSFVAKWEPLAAAGGLTLLMVIFVLIVIYHGVGTHRIDGTEYNPLQVLFLDKETDTYSLSKLQLYLWTVATIFGYVYLAVARSMIQKHFELPPVPQNLVNLLMVSLTTAVGAEAITGVHGTKGAGKVLPSLSDFITSGGVVAADRLQFFVWTWVGVIGFLCLIVISDPGTIEQLPGIPDGLLYMMGLSSAGYLGGKLTRTSGPVIDSIAAQHAPAVPAGGGGGAAGSGGAGSGGGSAGTGAGTGGTGGGTGGTGGGTGVGSAVAAPAAAAAHGRPESLVLVIEGQNLSSKADFYIDGIVLRVTPPDSKKVEARMDASLKVIKGDASAKDKSFSTALQLTVTDLPAWQSRPGAKSLAAWLAADPHKLKLVNPDGQEAEWPFTITETKPAR